MEGLLRISFDDAASAMRVEVQGFWDKSSALRYVGELETACRNARRRYGCVRLIVDSRQGNVLAQEVAQLFDRFEAIVDLRSDERLAVVVGSSLHRLQTARMLHRPGSRAFVDMAEAEAWIADAGIDRRS